MKKSTLALVVMGIVASASVQAAEIYNKDVINWMSMAKLKPCII